MDLIFIGATLAFLLLTIGLAVGCNKLGNKPGERP